MLTIDFPASASFSPNSEEFVVAEHGEMGEDFTISSKLEIYSPSMEKTTIQHEIDVPLALDTPVWNEDDEIAVSAGNGQILFTNSRLSEEETVDACDSEITALAYSSKIPKIMLAIGSEKGEILFFEDNALLYSTRNKDNENPHSALVSSINWNTRVSRICVSGDKSGKVIVWDEKKKAAIGSVLVSSPVFKCCFSEQVATCVLICCDDGKLCLWDMRRGEEYLSKNCSHKGEITAVEFLDDTKDLFAVRFLDGYQEIYELKAEEITYVGVHKANVTNCSLFYPNFALFENGNSIILKFVVEQCKELKPIVYNPLILTGIGDNDPEILEFEEFSVSNEGENQIIYLKKCNVVLAKNKYIRDMEDIVNMVTECLERKIELADTCNYFLKELQSNKTDLIEKYLLTVPTEDKVELKQEKKENAANNEEDDVDFFDQDAKEPKVQEEKACEQNKYSERVMDYIYNGDIESTINYLINEKELLMALVISLKFGFETSQVLETISRQIPDWHSILQIVDSITGTQKLDISKLSVENWQQSLRLIYSYDKTELSAFVEELLQIEKELSIEEIIDFYLYIDEKEKALDVIASKTVLSFGEELQLALECVQYGVTFNQNASEFEETIELLRDESEVDLATKLALALKIQASESVPEKAMNQHPPEKEEEKPQNSDFFTPATMAPTIQEPQNFELETPVEEPEKPASNDFFAFNEEQPQKENVVLAVNLLGGNTQQFQESQNAQPTMFAPPHEQSVQPEEQDMFTQPSASQEQPDIFMPEPPAAAQEINVFVPEPPAFNQQQTQELKSPSLIAPPPPTVNGNQIEQNHIRVQTTTAPPRENKKQPVESIDTTINGLAAIEKIDAHGNETALELIDLLREFHDKNAMSFNKNWIKLAECVTWLADPEPDLLSSVSSEAINEYVTLLAQHNVQSAEKVFSDFMKEHPKEFDEEISRWNGAFRIMSGCFK